MSEQSEIVEPSVEASPEGQIEEQEVEEVVEEQPKVDEYIKSFKLKVNGKEIEEKIDLRDEARLIKALQLEKASQEAFQRASSKEKELAAMNQQLDQFFELLKSNPMAILMNPELGINAEELASKILDARIEEESKTPEQKELEAAKKKLEEYERKQKEAAEEADRLRLEKLQNDYEQEIETSINGAIDKGELPNSPYIVAKFGQLMEAALEYDVDVSAEELIPIVKEAYMRDVKEMLGKLPDNIVEEIVSPDRMKSIRTKRIQEVKKTAAKVAQPKIEEVASKVKQETEKKRDPNFWKKFGDW